jgi:hypothetical protein
MVYGGSTKVEVIILDSNGDSGRRWQNLSDIWGEDMEQRWWILHVTGRWVVLSDTDAFE